MSRSIRRMVAALVVAVFLVQAGDAVMAAVCPPEEHLELHEEVTLDAADSPSAGDDEHQHGDRDHDHGDEGHCCPAAYGSMSACTGTVAPVDQGVDRLVPPAPEDTGPRLDDELPSDPFLSGSFRPPCA